MSREFDIKIATAKPSRDSSTGEVTYPTNYEQSDTRTASCKPGHGSATFRLSKQHNADEVQVDMYAVPTGISNTAKAAGTEGTKASSATCPDTDFGLTDFTADGTGSGIWGTDWTKWTLSTSGGCNTMPYISYALPFDPSAFKLTYRTGQWTARGYKYANKTTTLDTTNQRVYVTYEYACTLSSYESMYLYGYIDIDGFSFVGLYTDPTLGTSTTPGFAYNDVAYTHPQTLYASLDAKTFTPCYVDDMFTDAVLVTCQGVTITEDDVTVLQPLDLTVVGANSVHHITTGDIYLLGSSYVFAGTGINSDRNYTIMYTQIKSDEPLGSYTEWNSMAGKGIMWRMRWQSTYAGNSYYYDWIKKTYITTYQDSLPVVNKLLPHSTTALGAEQDVYGTPKTVTSRADEYAAYTIDSQGFEDASGTRVYKPAVDKMSDANSNSVTHSESDAARYMVTNP